MKSGLRTPSLKKRIAAHQLEAFRAA